MKKIAYHIIITIVALFASVVAMGQGGIYVPEGAIFYVSPNTVATGLPEIEKNKAIVYITKNTSVVIAANSIFTGQIQNIEATATHIKSIGVKRLPAIKKQIAAPRKQQATQLAVLPLSEHKKKPEITSGCGSATVPSTTHKSGGACLFLVINDFAGIKINKKGLKSARSATGTTILEVLDDNALFARPPTAS